MPDPLDKLRKKMILLEKPFRLDIPLEAPLFRHDRLKNLRQFVVKGRVPVMFYGFSIVEAEDKLLWFKPLNKNVEFPILLSKINIPAGRIPIESVEQLTRHNSKYLS
ncbi:MAG: hypothetical protein A2174_00480 [Candidatus Portnoybacteria bacterium RBG_13_41_18]|uniref:Uncharacterized protein n=1 Tax=Candidatus Portnoybacteria bacterium RBG_13_41_18 TaxID=1801991 RepID=A0A1G2FA35_9BACT|nr:MAG: hypothetical protein A2174_00480 [Candidatus Portnoybacteria bacterium RBG_13_41_18]